MALKYATNTSLSAITALPSAVPTDNLILISTQIASSSANISFTGINGTYDMYEFKFIDVRPATAGAGLFFNLSTDNGSNYNVTKTSTFFNAYHHENDSATGLAYYTGSDLAQSTADQEIASSIEGTASSTSGYLQLFNPSSTTYVKHWISNNNERYGVPGSGTRFTAGYANTTSAVNAIIFRMSSGNITNGIFKLYGVKKS
jgi:hypothetical protein